jgi:hypothetical protein
MVSLMRAGLMRRKSGKSGSYGSDPSDGGRGFLFFIGLLLLLLYNASFNPSGWVKTTKVNLTETSRLPLRYPWKEDCYLDLDCMKRYTHVANAARHNNEYERIFEQSFAKNPEEATLKLMCNPSNYFSIPEFFGRVRLDILTNRAIYSNIDYLVPKMGIMLSENIFNPRSANKEHPEWYTCPLPHYAKLLRVSNDRILDYFDLEKFLMCFDIDKLEKLLQSNDNHPFY